MIIGPGITIGLGATISRDAGTYTLEVGTKAPVLGAGAQSPFPASN